MKKIVIGALLLFVSCGISISAFIIFPENEAAATEPSIEYYHVDNARYYGYSLRYSIYYGSWKESDETCSARWYSNGDYKIVDVYTNGTLIWKYEYTDINPRNNIAQVRITRISTNASTGWINLRVFEYPTTGMHLQMFDIDERIGWDDGSGASGSFSLYLASSEKVSDNVSENRIRRYYHTQNALYDGNELDYSMYYGSWRSPSSQSYAKWFEYNGSQFVEIYSGETFIWEIEYKNLNPNNNIAQVRITRIYTGAHTGWINLRIHEFTSSGIDLSIEDMDERIGWTDGSGASGSLYIKLINN